MTATPTRKLINVELDEQTQIVWATDPETGERLYGSHLRPADYGSMRALGRAVIDVATDFSIFNLEDLVAEGEPGAEQADSPAGDLSATCS